MAKSFNFKDLKATSKQKPRLIGVTTAVNGVVLHFDNGKSIEFAGCHSGTPDMFDLTGHDFCLYCGYDNGKNGEYRNGHDCGYCGSN